MGPRVGGMLAVLARTGVCAFIIPECAPAVLGQSSPCLRHSRVCPSSLAQPGLPDFAPLGLRSKNKVFKRHGL